MSGGRTLVFDCFSGIAGDMTLAALVDAGASLATVRAGLDLLGLPEFMLATERVNRGGLSALHLVVTLSEERTYQADQMREMVERARFGPRVQARALAAIDALAAGEARAHRTDAPHLHEAGGVDAMIDLVGGMLALEDLDVAEAYCPIVTVGAGTIVTESSHGPLPAAPGPAAAAILQAHAFPLRFVAAGHELVTPTGAAILAAVAKPAPVVLTPTLSGAGAGTQDPPGRPNALRVFIGARAGAEAEAERWTAPGPPVEAAPAPPPVASPAGATVRELVLLEANIDDMPAALLAHARDQLMEGGALDAWTEPIGMKKGRAATKLCALVPPEEEARCAGIFLAETTTLGVRVSPYRRHELPRTVETFITSFGPVQAKVREWQGRRRIAPEFEDVKALARANNLPALEVQRRLEAELSGR